MYRITGLLLALLTSGALIASLSVGYLPDSALSQTRQKSILETLQSLFRPRRRSAATRGPICLITPGLRPEGMPLSETPFVLNDRPLFVWQKPIARLEVRLARTNAVVWHHALSPQSQRLLYRGTPLQPGQTYQVVAFGRSHNPLNVGEDAQFTLVDASQRDQMSRELAATEAALKKQKRSPEEIAIAKAIELSNRSLLSDAYQLLDLLPNKSSGLEVFLAKLSAGVCGD
jgi:hypothetical protein